MTRTATAQTMPAAAFLDRPCARDRSTSGAKTAATMIATAIDAVTAHTIEASNTNTAAKATTTNVRQPTAARLSSQGATSLGRRLSGPAVATAGCSVMSVMQPSFSRLERWRVAPAPRSVRDPVECVGMRADASRLALCQ